MERIYLDICSLKRPFDDQRQPLGFAPLDALHVALAEKAGARWFVTCDDRLMRLAARAGATLRTEVVLPPTIAWKEEP